MANELLVPVATLLYVRLSFHFLGHLVNIISCFVAGESFLINLIDSPGHIDFSSEVGDHSLKYNKICYPLVLKTHSTIHSPCTLFPYGSCMFLCVL